MSQNTLSIQPLTPTISLPLRKRVELYLRDLAYRICLYLAAYFVIALLSIGPCYWYWFGATYADGPKWIARFYAPLLWVCDHIPFVSWLVNWYISWW